MMLTSKPISGKEALKKGLVDAVEAADKCVSHQMVLRSVAGSVPLHWQPCSMYSGQRRYAEGMYIACAHRETLLVQGARGCAAVGTGACSRHAPPDAGQQWPPHGPPFCPVNLCSAARLFMTIALWNMPAVAAL